MAIYSNDEDPNVQMWDRQNNENGTQPNPRAVTITLNNMDWKALRRQKKHLLQVIGHYDGVPTNISASLDGILHLIDYIQDEAAQQIGSRAVFGK